MCVYTVVMIRQTGVCVCVFSHVCCAEGAQRCVSIVWSSLIDIHEEDDATETQRSKTQQTETTPLINRPNKTTALTEDSLQHSVSTVCVCVQIYGCMHTVQYIHDLCTKNGSKHGKQCPQAVVAHKQK